MSTASTRGRFAIRLRPRISVRRRLLLFVVASGLLGFGVLGVITFRIAESVSLQEVRARAQVMARSAALDVNERFARVGQSARAAAALSAALLESGALDPDVLRDALRGIAERELDFLNIYVIFDRQVLSGQDYAVVWETRDGTKGNFTTKPFHPNLPGAPGYDPDQPLYDYEQDNPRFQVARDAGRFAWTGVFRDIHGPPGKVFVMSGVAPIYDSSNRFIAAAGADLQFGKIRAYVAGLKPTPNGYPLLLDRSGTIIAFARDAALAAVDKPITQVAAESNSAALNTLGEQMLAGKSGILEMTDPLTGEDVFAAYAPIEETGWSLGLLIPRADLLGSVIDLRNSILGLTAIAVVALGSLGVALGETVARPLSRLTQTAMRIADGDLNQVAAVERPDEVGSLAETFNLMTSRLRDLIGSLEAQVEARTDQLRASADVGRAAVSILSPDRLLREVVNLITDRFGFYYAAIFTLDETGRFAVLREATGPGDAGRMLKERGHKLEVNGQSMVGFATGQRRPRIALDVGVEAVRFANPLLPETRSEIALPLIVGERVLGALDVQSTQAAAFDESSLAVLQSMADQVAVALANAQSFDTVQAALHTTTRLYELGRALFAATSPHDAYAAVVQESVRLAGLDRLSVILIAARDADREPIEYEVAAEWDATQGRQIESGAHCAPAQLPLASLVDRESIVVVRDAGDPALPHAARRSLEQAGWRAALIAPLIVRGQFDGFIAAAARRPIDFADGDVRYMQLMSEQLALVIGSQRSNEETRAALDRIALLNQRLSGEAWQRYLAARPGLTIQSGRVETERAANRLSTPIVVRGETLGTLDVEDADPDRQWTDDEWELLSAITGEVAQAIDNARLIEQAQLRVARERRLNQIAEKIRRAANFEAILRVAAEEVSQALDTSHANARLSVPARAAGRHNGERD